MNFDRQELHALFSIVGVYAPLPVLYSECLDSQSGIVILKLYAYLHIICSAKDVEGTVGKERNNVNL